MVFVTLVVQKNQVGTAFPDLIHKDTKVSFADFIGSDNCRACHADIYEQWKGSSHAQAGGFASRENVIAPFNGKPIVLNDAIVYPEVVNDKYQFRMERRNGDPLQTITVEYVVGKGLWSTVELKPFLVSFRMAPIGFYHLITASTKTLGLCSLK